MGTEDGIIIEGDIDYEDIKSFRISLAKHARKIKTYDFMLEQATGGAGATVEVAGVIDSVTLDEIGNTELTLICAMSANDNFYDGAEVIIPSYYDNKGTLHDAGYTATINTEDSTTEVVFDAAIADFYMFNENDLPYITKAVKAGHYCYIGVTGLAAGDVMCTIQPLATIALAEDCYGVGSVFGEAEADQSELQGALNELGYLNYLGVYREAYCYLDDSDASAFVRYFDSLTDKPVNDFYRRRKHTSEVAAHAGENIRVCDHDAGKIYSIIQPAFKKAIFSKFVVGSEDHIDTYLAYVSTVYQHASESATLTVSVVGAEMGTLEHPMLSKANTLIEWNQPMLLEKGSEVEFNVVDDAGDGANLQTHIIIIEAYNYAWR